VRFFMVSSVRVLSHGFDLVTRRILCHLENIFILNSRQLINKIK
jgi:hypothetical protein